MKNNLEFYRKKCGYNKTETARYLNISERQYQRLERDIPKSVQQFCKLAELFEATLDKLITDESDRR